MDDELLPVSALERFAFCPRQAYLFHAEGQKAENVYTIEGRVLHNRVTDGEDETRPGVRICRSLPVVSYALGLRGVADVVEMHDGRPVPIEYKRGGKRQRAHEHLQLAAQAMCLEEMMKADVPEGFIYHAQTRRRERVAIDQELRACVVALADEIRRVLSASQPPAARHGSWCASCSLVDRCLPAVTRGGVSAEGWIARSIGEGQG